MSSEEAVQATLEQGAPVMAESNAENGEEQTQLPLKRADRVDSVDEDASTAQRPNDSADFISPVSEHGKAVAATGTDTSCVCGANLNSVLNVLRDESADDEATPAVDANRAEKIDEMQQQTPLVRDDALKTTTDNASDAGDAEATSISDEESTPEEANAALEAVIGGCDTIDDDSPTNADGYNSADAQTSPTADTAPGVYSSPAPKPDFNFVPWSGGILPPGISQTLTTRRYSAKLEFAGNTYPIGTFDTAEEAIMIQAAVKEELKSAGDGVQRSHVNSVGMRGDPNWRIRRMQQNRVIFDAAVDKAIAAVKASMANKSTFLSPSHEEADISQKDNTKKKTAAPKRTKIKGVYTTSSGRFQARKGFLNRQRNIGTFDTIEEAKMALEEMTKELPSRDKLPEGLSMKERKAMFEQAKEKVLKIVASKKLPPGIRVICSGHFELRFTFRGKTKVVGAFDKADKAVYTRKRLKGELAKISSSKKMSAEEVEVAFDAAKEVALSAAKGIDFDVKQNEETLGAASIEAFCTYAGRNRHIGRFDTNKDASAMKEAVEKELEKSKQFSLLSDGTADEIFQRAINRASTRVFGSALADSEVEEDGNINFPRSEHSGREEAILYLSFGHGSSDKSDFAIKQSDCLTCSCVEGPSLVSGSPSEDDSDPATKIFTPAASVASGSLITPSPSAKRRKLLDSRPLASPETASDNQESIVHEFLLSLHKSITPDNLFSGWLGNGTLRIIDVEVFEEQSLPKIRYWREIKAKYQSLKNFAEACGFMIWEKRFGCSVHTFMKHTCFQRHTVEEIKQIFPSAFSARRHVGRSIGMDRAEMFVDHPDPSFVAPYMCAMPHQQPLYSQYGYHPPHPSFYRYYH